MQSSLILQSRELIEKLSNKKGRNFEDPNSVRCFENTELPCDLTNRNNLRRIDNTHDISDSIPKSTVSSILSRSAYLSKSDDKISSISTVSDPSDMPKRVPFGIFNYTDQIEMPSNGCSNLKSLDLMGYDWIAGMMENKAKESQLDQPQEYFEELEKFRRQNKQYCISTENRQSSNNTYSPYQSNYKKAFNDFNYNFQPSNSEILDTSEENQQELYAYTLNERLFPIPLDMETAQRGQPNPNNPHMIKISIPSNRFAHRNHKIQTLKDKTAIQRPKPDGKLLGESLSLSSHCQLSGNTVVSNVHSQNKAIAATSRSYQEPASLRGHIVTDATNCTGEFMFDAMSPFGGNQPRCQQEAIDQLRRGKTGAKLSRMVPSVLVNRSLNLESSLSDTVNICQTRITLKDIDDSKPRSAIKPRLNQSDNGPSNHDHVTQGSLIGVPRPSLSRQQMSKVYGDAMTTVWCAAAEDSKR